MNYFFVNQGKTYKAEKKGGFIWAPIKNKRGRTEGHWESMQLVNKGDIIFSNFKGNIISVNIATSNCYLNDRPIDIKDYWEEKGRTVDLIYNELNVPIRFNHHSDYIVKHQLEKGPFDINGNAKMGYFFELGEELGNFFLSKLSDEDKKIIDFEVNNIVSEEFKEVIEEQNQFEKINNGAIKGYTEEELQNIQNKPYEFKERSKKQNIHREKTDPKLKASRLEKAEYLCEISPDHKTFSNTTGQQQYLECHHLIPMNAQKDYPSKKLDNLFNLIVVCPICHAQIHYGSEQAKQEMFKKMYMVRKNELLENGFDYKQLKEIFEKYY